MAKMYPNNITICNSPAEKKLFNIFKNFSDDYHIIHSLAWLSKKMINTTRYSPEGEIDFVIINKEFGILCIEVKGGIITYKEHAYFTSNNTQIKNPYHQVRTNTHFVRENITTILKNSLIGYAVGFPDCIASKLNDDHPFITFDLNDLSNLEKKIENIFFYWKKSFPYKSAINELDMKNLISYLMPTSIDELNNKIIYDNKTWLSLSEQQTDSLDIALNNDRFFISGRAGTGKTIIAIILARLLSEKYKILFLTFNKIISEKISGELSETRNVECSTFHKFLMNYNTLEDITNSVNNENTIFKHIIESQENNFDVLIIDEAQSFSAVWLTYLYKYFENRKIYIFSDELQSFTHEGRIDNNQMKKILSIEKEITLTLNYRSPYKVYKRLLEMFDSSIQQVTPRNQDILDLIEIVTDNPRQTVLDCIKNLEEKNIIKDNITILVSSIEKNNLKSFNYGIEVQTVQKYRGMEKPIIIYIMTSGSEKDLHELYVAYSRSTTQTIVIIPEHIFAKGKSIFEEILLKSNLTDDSLKNELSNRGKVFIDKLLSNYKENKFKNFSVYYNDKYFFFPKENLNFLQLLLIDYVNYKSILAVKVSDYSLNNAYLIFDNKRYNLDYDYCKTCNTQIYRSKDFCFGCDENQFRNIDIVPIINNLNNIYNIKERKERIKDSEMNDSFRSLGRLIFTEIINKLSDKTILMLNEQNNLKYISCIIEFLIYIYYEKNSSNFFDLDELRISSRIKMLNGMDENWEATSGYCINIFLLHKLFKKAEKKKKYFFKFDELFKI